jgi:hypothetical protein
MWTFGLENVKGRNRCEDDGVRREGSTRLFVKEVGAILFSPALQPPPPRSKEEGSFSLPNGYQCPLLNRMYLTFTAWVQSLNTCDDGRGKHTDPVKNASFGRCTTTYPPVAIC